MVKILSNILMSKDIDKYNKFKILRDLLVFTSENCDYFEVNDEYLVEILNDYISDRKHERKANTILNDVTDFYEEIIELYKEGKFGKFNFIVEKYNFGNELKRWFRDYKEEILSFFRFYIENQGLKLLNVIYSNKYFKVIQIEAEEKKEFLTPYLHPQEIVIRIMLDGKMYYKEGILLEKDQYIIAGPLGFLGGWKILSPKINLILITIKKEFLDKFNLFGLDKVVHTLLTLHQKKLLNFLNKEYLEQNPFYLTEIITFFLHINNFFTTDIEPISYALTKKINWLKVVNIINDNIKKSVEELEKIVCSKLDIKKKYLEDIMYLYERTTFQKFIYNKKIDKIIEEYLVNKRELDELLEEYEIKNKLIFRYNLEKFYNLSIREVNYSLLKVTS